MSEQQTAQETVPEKTSTICPCCGKPTLEYPIQHIPDVLLDQFMACMMSGTPFTHRYEMYDGRMAVTVSQMTEEHRLIVTEILRILDVAKDTGLEVPGVDLTTLGSIARTFVHITEIDIKAGGVTKSYRPSDLVRDIRDRLHKAEPDKTALADAIQSAHATLTSPNNMAAVPPAQILAVIETHAKVLDILMDAGFDKNFWKGIELA